MAVVTEAEPRACSSVESAMAWVAYQDGHHTLRNQDTFRKVELYLQPGFLRDLFDRYLV